MILEKRKVTFIKPRHDLSYTKEEKFKILREGLSGKSSILEFCLEKGIDSNLYFKWSKELSRNAFIQENWLRLHELEIQKVKTENGILTQLIQELSEKNEKIKANLGITD